MDLVIMAAGMGSRFGGSKQTQIIGNNGEFIIDYSIYDAIKTGFKRVIFIIRKENFESFEESIGKRIKKYIEVLYVFQDIFNIPIKLENKNRIKPWGTGHALLSIKDVVKDKFVIINADDFYGRDAFIKIFDYLKSNENYALVGYKLINTLSKNGSVSRGICSYKDGYLDKLNERLGVQIRNNQISYLENDKIKIIDKNSNVSVNFFGLDSRIFKYAEQYFIQFLTNPNTDLLKSEFYLPTIVQNMIDENIVKMKVIETNDIFCGITYKEDLIELKEHIDNLIKKGVYPDKLWQ